MKRLLSVTCSIRAICSIQGCWVADNLNKTMSSWEGHHFSELIMSWGPPSQVYDDGQGGRIFVYLIDHRYTYTEPGKATTTSTGNASIIGDQGWASARSITTYTPPQTYEGGSISYRTFI